MPEVGCGGPASLAGLAGLAGRINLPAGKQA